MVRVPLNVGCPICGGRMVLFENESRRTATVKCLRCGVKSVRRFGEVMPFRAGPNGPVLSLRAAIEDMYVEIVEVAWENSGI